MLSLIFLELTVREILADLPHDGGALVVFLIVAASLGFICHGSRKSAADSRRRSRGEAAAPRPRTPTVRSGEVEGPELDHVSFAPSTFSTAPEIQRSHPEVR